MDSQIKTTSNWLRWWKWKWSEHVIRWIFSTLPSIWMSKIILEAYKSDIARRLIESFNEPPFLCVWWEGGGGGYLDWLKIVLKNASMFHVNYGQVGPKSSIAKVFWQMSFNPETDGWCIYRPLFFEEKLQILLYGRLTPLLKILTWSTGKQMLAGKTTHV